VKPRQAARVKTCEPRTTMSTSSFATRYGPWALVTGAARGLGAAYCELLVERGLAVLALDRRAELLDERVAALRARGGEVEAMVLDLASEDLERALADQLAGREVGLLVNNAALSYAESILDQPLAQLRRVQRINCDAALILTHTLARAMRARGRGGIVVVSSLSSVYGGPLVGHYAATKAFDAVLAESLADELRGTGVDVSAVLAPLMDTPGMRATRPTRLTTQLVSPAVVARRSLDALGRRARVVVGRDAHLLLALARLLPRAWIRRLVVANIDAMYEGRAS